MIESLRNHLIENFISFEEKDNVFIINEKSYGLSIPIEVEYEQNGKLNKKEILFNDKFHFVGELINKKSKCDFYVYQFGGVWYYLEKGKEKDVKLNYLKYIGKDTSLKEVLIPVFLGVHGPFELLNGTGDYSLWCKKAKFMNIDTLGLCEKNTLAGILKFQLECQKNEIIPILGEEITVLRVSEDIRYTLKCFVKNEEGWINLLMINSIINEEERGYIEEEILLEMIEGLAVIIDPKTCNHSEIKYQLKGKIKYYQLDTVEFEKEDKDTKYLQNLQCFYKDISFEPIAVFDAYGTDKEYLKIKEKLNKIGKFLTHKTYNQYFKNWKTYKDELSKITNEKEIEGLFEQSINNLIEVTNQCDYLIDTDHRHLPTYKMTKEESKVAKTNIDLFWYLIEKGVENHPEIFDKYEEEMIFERIEMEAKVIEEGGVVDYFLTLHDIVSWAGNNEILMGTGRGSVAGSIIAYLLNLCFINPLDYGLIFERFLTLGRLVRTSKETFLTFVDEEGNEISVSENEKVKVKRGNWTRNIPAKFIKENDEIII